jgi:hypothetical protein
MGLKIESVPFERRLGEERPSQSGAPGYVVLNHIGSNEKTNRYYNDNTMLKI